MGAATGDTSRGIVGVVTPSVTEATRRDLLRRVGNSEEPVAARPVGTPEAGIHQTRERAQHERLRFAKLRRQRPPVILDDTFVGLDAAEARPARLEVQLAQLHELRRQLRGGKDRLHGPIRVRVRNRRTTPPFPLDTKG